MSPEGGLTWTVYDADNMTQAEIYGFVLSELGKSNPKIVGLSADLAKSTKSASSEKNFLNDSLILELPNKICLV
jgi:transketolase